MGNPPSVAGFSPELDREEARRRTWDAVSRGPRAILPRGVRWPLGLLPGGLVSGGVRSRGDLKGAIGGTSALEPRRGSGRVPRGASGPNNWVGGP